MPFVNAAAPSVGDHREVHFHNLNVMSLVREQMSCMILWSDVAEFIQYFKSDSSTFLHSVGNLVFHFQVVIK